MSGFDATIRSCCVGGWGQMYRGETSKGRKMMIAWGVTGGATLVSWIIAGNKENAYKDLSSIQPEDFDDAYEEYKLWFNIAAANTIVFLGVHAYNLFDIIFRKPQTRTSMTESERGFICEANPHRVQVGYRLSF